MKQTIEEKIFQVLAATIPSQAKEGTLCDDKWWLSILKHASNEVLALEVDSVVLEKCDGEDMPHTCPLQPSPACRNCEQYSPQRPATIADRCKG